MVGDLQVQLVKTQVYGNKRIGTLLHGNKLIHPIRTPVLISQGLINKMKIMEIIWHMVAVSSDSFRLRS